MLESQAINDTYLALVKVFHALKQKQKLSAFCRDAKLTRLLRAALESKKSPCLVLITVSPSRFRFQATLNTFQYLQLNGTPLQVQPNGGVEVPPLPLQNAGVRKIVFPENKRQFSARDNRSYSARLHPPGGGGTTTATTPTHGSSAGVSISGPPPPPPNKLSLRPSHSARRIRPPPSAPVQGRQKAGVNVRASAEDLRQLAARSAHVFAAAKNKSASAQSARPGNKSRSFAAASPSHQAFLADDISYKGTSTKDEVGLGNDEINSEDVLDELDEDWKNARSIEVEEYEAFNRGGSDENDRRPVANWGSDEADVGLTFADRVAKAESLKAEPGERGRAGSQGSGGPPAPAQGSGGKPQPGTGGKAEAIMGAAGSSSFPLPSSGEVEKQKLSGEKKFRGPSPSRGFAKNSREPGQRNSTEIPEKNGGGDQAQVAEDHDHPDNSKQMLPPIKTVGGEPETTEVDESPVTTTTPKNWSMANNFPSRPSSAGAPAAPSSPRVQKFLQERSPQLLARAAQLQQLQQEYVRPPPDVEPVGDRDQPRGSPLPAPSSPSEGREGVIMDPTSTSTSSRTSSRNHSSVGTSEAYSEDFNTNTSPEDQDCPTTSSDHSKVRKEIDSERTTADSWQRSVEEVGRNLGQIAALRGEKRKVGAGEAAEVGAGQSTSSTNKGHGAQALAAVGGGDVDEKANAATKTTTTKTTTTKTATSQETVRENRERLERGLTEQKPSKIGKPSMNAKAWSGMTKGNQPSQEILNGMRSCLRPPSNIRKVGGLKTSDDLSTTKIVRNYFPAQDKLEI